MTERLKPCPFCGRPVKVKDREYNPYAHCGTAGCKGSQLPLLNLDQPDDIAAWNRRPAQYSREMRAVLAMILGALDRDAAEGRPVRGEMADELRALLGGGDT